jgi:hypothetical protein
MSIPPARPALRSRASRIMLFVIIAVTILACQAGLIGAGIYLFNALVSSHK